MSADGAELPVGETGELWIRGPNVSPGYWENDVAANEAFADGFWRSGDIGSRDEEGRLYIHDRLKDMITRGGFKVFSAEVENALMAHPDVADCAVFGVPDSVLGERTVAQIMLKTDDEIDGDALLAFLTDRIADYKLPDFWRLGRDPLPRNQNGKLQKAVLRDAMLAEQAPRDTS
ncbi:class I adenylate-forming enzyme family protein [Ruegeria jejuensis]|uniref:class I adenylate-forming enzyme family protein n=1 Tax=Ruegeria jejuensis TaxID=3233338 RepID=UPI00355BA3C2